MKATVLLVVFGLCLTWLRPTEGQRDGKGNVRVPPSIASIFPEKYFMPSGGKVIHKCDLATGDPKPEIYWQYYENGVFKDRLYPTASDRTYNGSQLILRHINPNEQYQCVASNLYGKALSTKIRVYQARGAFFVRKVKQNPYSFTKNVGQPLLIPCKYERAGIPEDIYSWRYSDDDGTTGPVAPEKRIKVSDDGSLAFSYVKSSDGKKTYYCNIDNRILNLFSYGSWSKLDVTGGNDVPDSPIALLYATANNTVAEYRTEFKMQCIFGGNPVPTVRWEPPPSSRLIGRILPESYELVINSVSEEDEGIYKCTGMQGLANPVTVAFFIDVKGPPIWVNKPKSIIVAQGQKGVFTCEARPLQGEKPLLKPKWFKNGVPLQVQYGGIDGKTQLSADGKILTIHDASKADDICNYQCSVSNDEDKEVFADAYFNVILNTEVLDAPVSQTIDKGEVAIFDIRAQTDPLKEGAMQYKWSLNGNEINFLDLNDIYILPNNSLVVNTTGMDENRFQVVLGNYSVSISNTVEIVTRYATLMGNPVKIPVVSQSGMDLRWIALIVAVVLLFIIFILLLCVLFNRHGGDDYSVDKKERKAGHDPEKELADSGFHDLPRTDDDPDRQKPDNVSISSTAKSMGSETDSMEEYSDADAGSRFNEDGSFIGAYQGHESKGNVSNV